MEFDEEGMEVFKRLVDKCRESNGDMPFELAGKIVLAARWAMTGIEEVMIGDDISELYEAGAVGLKDIMHEFLITDGNVSADYDERMLTMTHIALNAIYNDEEKKCTEKEDKYAT